MISGVVVIVAVLTSIWKVSQLLRAPEDRALQIVATCTIAVALAMIAPIFVELYNPTSASSGEGLSALIQFLLVTWFFCALLCLLQSALVPDTFRRWGWVELGLAGLTTVLMLGVFSAANPASSWMYTSGQMDGHVMSFYCIGNSYALYACLRGASLSWSANSRVPRSVSVSLRVASVGLIINALLSHAVRVGSTGTRLVFGSSLMPVTLDNLSQNALRVGIVLFSVGIAYPGLRTASVKLRLWFRNRRRYRALYRLWAALVGTFPAIALDGPVGPVRDRLATFRLGLKYYRRLIECRDGLMHLSPYLQEPNEANGPYTMQVQARMVVEALKSRQRGDSPTGGVVAIAAPTGEDGADDDARQLVRLAHAYDRVERDDGTSLRIPDPT